MWNALEQKKIASIVLLTSVLFLYSVEVVDDGNW